MTGTGRLVPIPARALLGLVEPSDGSHRAVALRHAAHHDRPGTWGDDPDRPTGVVWIRDGGDRIDAFAAGRPRAILTGLTGLALGRPVALAAPGDWWACPEWPHAMEPHVARTFTLGPKGGASEPGPSVRRLDPADLDAFARSGPAWAWRAWGDPATLLGRAVGFGVPHGAGFAALAWEFETDGQFSKLGVATAEPLRRLGLGRAVAAALVAAVMARGRVPLWTTSAGDPASERLARSLGFGDPTDEPWALWHPA